MIFFCHFLKSLWAFYGLYCPDYQDRLTPLKPPASPNYVDITILKFFRLWWMISKIAGLVHFQNDHSSRLAVSMGGSYGEDLGVDLFDRIFLLMGKVDARD